MQQSQKQIEEIFSAVKVLIVDDEPYMRKVVRTLLLAIGIKRVVEAGDVPDGLHAIKTATPDLVLLDWEMPGMNGAEFMRFVRSPEHFPLPDIPVIMLTGSAERSRVIEAVRLGVHEYLLKPVSSQALLARIASVLLKPRRMVRIGNYYGPEPRKLSSYKPEYDPGHSEVALVN